MTARRAAPEGGADDARPAGGAATGVAVPRRSRGVRALAGALAAASACAAAPAFAEAIVEARYAAPTDRYGHYALGRSHEYARLAVVTDRGRALVLELPADEVFEDLAPHPVRLAPGAPGELLAVVSGRAGGARLALFGLRRGRLERVAESDPIGTPMRWLNPVGAADLDGDGRAEIAAVVTPHIGGTLKVWRRQGARLVEAASLAGFSNHVYGRTELGLSLPMAVEGRMRLVVPDAARSALRVVALDDGRLVETGRCALAAPLAGALRVVSPSAVAIERPGGREIIVPATCPKPAR